LESLVAVAIGLTLLYCAQALGLAVYPYTAYVTVTAGRSTFARDFLTFSPFAGLALAYLLSHPEARWRWVAGMAITSAGFMLTFTRSWIAAALVATSISAVYFSTRFGGGRRRAAAVIGIGLSAAVGLAGVYVISSDSVQAIGTRFAEARSAGLAAPNLKARSQPAQEIAKALSRNGAILIGVGFVPYGTVPGYLRASTAFVNWGDSTWNGVLAYTGAAGTALFGCVLLACLVLGLKLARTEAGRARFGLMLALVFAQMIVVSFFSDNYLGLGVMSGMFFACLTVARYSLWGETAVPVRGTVDPGARDLGPAQHRGAL